MEENFNLDTDIQTRVEGNDVAPTELGVRTYVNNDIFSEISVSKRENSITDIEIDTVYRGNTDKEASLEIYFGNLADDDKLTEITSRIQRYVEEDVVITSRVYEESEKHTEITPTFKNYALIDSEIDVVAYGQLEILSELYVRAIGNADVDTVLAVEVDGLHQHKAYVGVWGYDEYNLNTEFVARAIDEFQIDSELYVRALHQIWEKAVVGVWGYINDDNLQSEITVRTGQQDTTDVEIHTRAFTSSSIKTLLSVITDGEHTIDSEVRVVYPAEHTIDSEIFVRHYKWKTIPTEISVKPNNRMYLKYKLYAVGQSAPDTELEVKQYGVSTALTEIYARAIDFSNRDTEIFAIYRGNSDKLISIQPIIYNFMPTEISVRPHNRMYSIYEIQQPPIIRDIFNPIQDAFTRSSHDHQAINYGYNSSMVVGKSQYTGEVWRSFLQFDLSWVNPSYILKGSYLRLYYTSHIPETIKLEILNAKDIWTEGSITDLNRPTPIELIADEFTINEVDRYIEFEVLDVVKKWVDLSLVNNGFIVRIANETENASVTFRTRESYTPPELVVDYYDSRIFSHGRSQIPTEIFAFKSDNSDKRVEITVDSTFTNEETLAEIRIHRVEVPFDEDYDTEITVNAYKREAEVSVILNGQIEAPAEITVYYNTVRPMDSILAEIIATRYVVPVEITPIFTVDGGEGEEDTGGEDGGDTETPTQPKKSRPKILTEITAVREEVNAEISVPVHDYDTIDVELEINEVSIRTIDVEITVVKHTWYAEVSARKGALSDLHTILTVSNVKKPIEILVPFKRDIRVEIDVIVKSDTVATIFVARPDVQTEILPRLLRHNELETEIYVYNYDTVLAEIDAKKVSQVDTEIDIKAVSQVATEITVTKKIVPVQITVPTWASIETYAEVQPRILMVKDVYTAIQVGGVKGAYAFII